MSKLRISGDSSGYVDLEAPATAGTTTIALEQIPLKNAVNTFTSNMTVAGNVGIGTVSPAGKLHVKTSASGATAVAGADDLVIEHADYGGMSILSENEGHIYFGDNEDADVGRIEYQHNANAMVFRTNATDAMTINGAGIVTKPLQPSFKVHQDVVTGLGTGHFTGTFNDTETGSFDIGNNFSSNIFTAPVSGSYHFDMSVRIDHASTYFRAYIVKNNISNSGTSLHAIYGNSIGTNYESLQLSGILYLSVNDTARVKVYSDVDTSWIWQGEGFFSGHLIG